LQNPSETNGDSLNDVRHKTSRTSRNEKREYLKEKNELGINNKHKNISDLHRGISEFKKGYQPTTNLVKRW
jgi:hypothetical protein